MQLFVLIGALVLTLVNVIIWRKVMATLDDVLGEVTQETTLDASLLTLVQGLQAQVTAAAGDPAKIQAIFDGVKANIATVSAAVAAGTTSQPAS